MRAFVVLVASVAALAFSDQASARQLSGWPPETNLPGPTTKVLSTLSSAVLFAIESSRLAFTRGRSARVREIADRMVVDHGRIVAEMRFALDDIDASLPPLAMETHHLRMLHGLKMAGGADFDRVYVDTQQKVHFETIALLTRFSRSRDNDRLRALAADLLPVLKDHLDDLNKRP